MKLTKEIGLAVNAIDISGGVPEWLELVPKGPNVTGRDGRAWLNDRPEDILAHFNSMGTDLVVDIEHASEIKAPKGEPAPAAGWIQALELRDGAVWGRVAWNAAAREMIEKKGYRYYSPAFLYRKDNSRIVGLSSVGLTNKPNLRVAALNHQLHEEDTTMLKKILIALGLAEDATEEQALNAIEKKDSDLATALNRANTPDLGKFVPRADYDAALARASNAETALDERVKAELEATITTEVDAACKAGKITPATKDYYTAMCRQEGGLEAFRKFIEAAPVVGDPSGKDKTPPDHGTALNAEQQQVADMFGNSAEDIAKYGK